MRYGVKARKTKDSVLTKNKITDEELEEWALSYDEEED